MNKPILMLAGRCLTARATHASHRTRLHRLGLSVGIAIALCGCGRTPFDEREADPIQYSTVKDVIEFNRVGADLAKSALRDGVLTEDEYTDIILAPSQAREPEFVADKERLIAEYSKADSK